MGTAGCKLRWPDVPLIASSPQQHMGSFPGDLSRKQLASRGRVGTLVVGLTCWKRHQVQSSARPVDSCETGELWQAGLHVGMDTRGAGELGNKDKVRKPEKNETVLDMPILLLLIRRNAEGSGISARYFVVEPPTKGRYSRTSCRSIIAQLDALLLSQKKMLEFASFAHCRRS